MLDDHQIILANIRTIFCNILTRTAYDQGIALRAIHLTSSKPHLFHLDPHNLFGYVNLSQRLP